MILGDHVVPVRERKGPRAGSWQCRIIGPAVDEGKSGNATIYSGPSLEEARSTIAEFLGVSKDAVVRVRRFPRPIHKPAQPPAKAFGGMLNEVASILQSAACLHDVVSSQLSTSVSHSGLAASAKVLKKAEASVGHAALFFQAGGALYDAP